MHHRKGRRRNVKLGGRKDNFAAEASIAAVDRDRGNFQWQEEAPESGGHIARCDNSNSVARRLTEMGRRDDRSVFLRKITDR